MSDAPPVINPEVLARIQDTAGLVNRLQEICKAHHHEVAADALLSLYVHVVTQCAGCSASAAQALPLLAQQLAQHAASLAQQHTVH